MTTGGAPTPGAQSRKRSNCRSAGVGFAFIEVLSECPVHLGLEPEAAEDWVRDNMEPVFPLGVKKDVSDAQSFPVIPKADLRS